MPIIWRYLISSYLKITLASVGALIAILLTMRLDEIAHFASLGAPIGGLLLFVFYQIFYILPIALPLSCLIAAFILIQKLSKTHELTALRASGFALKDILTPILMTALFLTIFNFWIISELATHSHLKTNLLKSELRAVNPLLLLHNKHLMRAKGFYFDSFGPSKIGEFASDVILAIPSKHQKRLNLFIAKNIESNEMTFKGQKVTLLSSLKNDQGSKFDDLFIENIDESANQVNDFSQVLQKKVWTINNDYLQLPLLLIRAEEQKDALKAAKIGNFNKSELKKLKAQLNSSHSEIIKRLSIGLAAFSFTLLGLAFGMKIGRQHSYKSLFLAVGLTTFYLISFFVAKGLSHQWGLSTALYLVPHLILIFASLLMINRVARGVE